MDPLIITVASTNTKWTKKDSPYLPETPEEIADDIVKAYQEGAAVAHIHARDENGNVTFDPKYFRKIVEQVRKQCNIIIELSTAGPSVTVEEKLAPIRELLPDRASLNIRGSNEEIEYTAGVMEELGVVPVIEDKITNQAFVLAESAASVKDPVHYMSGSGIDHVAGYSNRKGGMKMARYSRSKGVSVVLAVVLIVCLAGLATAQHKFPSKAINNVVFSSAGGGTDVINRFLALQMEKTLGQKIIVSNMPGGLGGTAAEYVWQQSHDGYTLLGVSETATTFLVTGATKHGISDWVFYIAAGSPGIVAVKAGSPYQDLDDLLKAAKDRPKTVKIGNSGTGKLWHIKVSILERNAGVQFMHVPYNGSNPAILSVLSGETNAVSAAFGEVSEQVRAGKMKIIAVTEADRIKAAGVDTVPSLTEVFPAAAKYLPLQQWLGFAVPKDVPAAVQRVLGTAFEKAVQSPEVNLFFKQQYMERIGLWGEEANAFAQTMESGISWISKELGVAKNDPAALNMAKPAWMK